MYSWSVHTQRSWLFKRQKDKFRSNFLCKKIDCSILSTSVQILRVMQQHSIDVVCLRTFNKRNRRKNSLHSWKKINMVLFIIKVKLGIWCLAQLVGYWLIWTSTEMSLLCPFLKIQLVILELAPVMKSF
jgi:hypothetical protein